MEEKEILIKNLIKSRIKNSADLDSLKRRLAKKYKIPCPANTELLTIYRDYIKSGKIKPRKNLENILKIRGIRSLSGVAVVSVLTKSYPCPGKCLYCPTINGMPKSYLPNEPAVMRAIANKFDPYSQVQTRIKALEAIGHPADKIELIIIGGTWSYLPKKYQKWFIKQCFKSCNEFHGRKRPGPQTLEKLQKINETAKNRIVGITIETRPDFININEIKWLRKLGVTRVELGVQSIYDDVLNFNLRGHNISKTIEATKILKDAGFKICYHIMPGLPGSNLRRDEKMFEELFKNPDFQPDFLKIYPCVVLKKAKIYQFWQGKKYKPYSCNELLELLTAVKQKVPYYVRIQRLIRDIPSSEIIAGCAISNLRQILKDKSRKEGWECKCIRCREIKDEYKPNVKLKIFRQDYDASGGKEIFLSYEDVGRKNLYSLLRLRIPSFVLSRKKKFLPVLKNCAIIREVHTYGQMLQIKIKDKKASQHKGLGKKLIKEAEKIAKKEFNLKKVAVISGVGARNYYRKLGYKLKNTYMIKNL